MAEIEPKLRRFLLGDTDSEVVFLIFLSHLSEHGPLSRRHTVDDVSSALRAAIVRVRAIADTCTERRASLTLMVTDGDTMGGHRRRQRAVLVQLQATLCRSRRLPQPLGRVRGAVAHRLRQPLHPVQRAAARRKRVEKLEDGDVIGVDWRMRATRTHIDRVPMPMAAAQ